MMNDAVSERIFAMFNTIDNNRWLELQAHFDQDIEYRRPGYEPITGLAALIDFYCNTRKIKSGKHTIELLCQDCETAAVSAIGSFAGLDRSGQPLLVRFCDVYYLKSSKIWRRETFFHVPAV